MDLDKRFKNGEFTNADSIHFSDSLKYYTLREHRTVYGGGGIMPDHFVPLDTTRFTKFHRQLSAKNYIINANLKYIDNNRKQLKKQYKTFEEFNRQFEVPQSLLDNIISEAAKADVKPTDDDELAHTLPYLRTQLKALIARDLWDMTEYFQVMNETNPIVLKGLEVLGISTMNPLHVER
jgi:carboxyl-terminal processing protease